MSTYANLSLRRDDNDLIWLDLDVKDKSTNVLGIEVLEEIQRACEEIRTSGARGLVIHSSKPGGFVAGADINHFREVNSEAQALALIEQGQRVFQAYEDLPMPTLVIIRGLCLGGGLEWALACDYRIACSDAQTKIGLPEVKLGIHPGFGGSVRAIRLIGVLAAMQLMLTGRSIDGRQAKKIGLVDENLPQRSLHNAAVAILSRRPPRHEPKSYLQLLETAPLRPLVAKMLRRQVAKKANEKRYPAPYALIDLWERHGSRDPAMFAAEAHSVARLIVGQTAQNLVRIFFLQERLKGLGDRKRFRPRHVHVIGAGVMGGDIAAWCVMQGMRVTLQDSSDKALARAVSRASDHFVKRYRHDRPARRNALDRLIPDRDGLGVKKADLIIEAVFEDLQVKQSIFTQLERQARKDAILATNTSSIPLDEIAQAMTRPERLVGLHFFNPVVKMPLVEVVFDADLTSEDVRSRALAATRHLNKLPLPVRSAPGFLVNRILMPYLMEAIKCHDEGIPAVVIDRAATDYGMPMGPLALADTVGLDICQHVGRILAEKLGLELPDTLDRMIEKGWLGKKSGQGFYIYRGGKPTAREKPDWHGDRQALQQRLIEPIVNEAQRCLEENIVADRDLLDAGLIFGAGIVLWTDSPREPHPLA